MTMSNKLILGIVASIALFTLFNVVLANSYVFAQDPDGSNEGMQMGGDLGMQSTDMGSDPSMQGINMGDNSATQVMPMQMGMTDTWQDNVNKFSYPLTAILALFAAWVCFRLIRATAMVDIFALITTGMVLVLIQAIAGVLFYSTDGSAIDMPTLMFMMSFFNSLAMLAIGYAFYKWVRMINA